MQLFVTSFGPIEAHPSCGNFATTQFASSLRARSLSTLQSPLSLKPRVWKQSTSGIHEPEIKGDVLITSLFQSGEADTRSLLRSKKGSTVDVG